MPKDKDKKAKKISEKRAKRTTDGAAAPARGGAAERPPESAEDFGHVLRRLLARREVARPGG